MPRAGETVVGLPHTDQAGAGLCGPYERVESGPLPAVAAAAAAAGVAGPADLARAGTLCRDMGARYPHSKRVGPYLIGKTIGEGSFAKVREGLHSVVGEKVAIKITDKKVAGEDAYLRKNMRREAGLLQSLRHHPNIVSLYEVMETDHNFYMVLELCTGGALLDRICSEKCLLEGEARRYVGQIVSAVDHMHQAGILHRDLKVENLLLDENNDIKIIDFGLSNAVSLSNGRLRADFRGTQCGSPAYAAPEIIANRKYGAKVDVWSIGVNTFAMLAGCLPFTVEPFNIKLLVKKIYNGEMAEIPIHLSEDCKDFIRKLLQPDPRLRYSVPEALAHPWLAAGKGATKRPRTPTSPPPPPPGLRRRLSRMALEADVLHLVGARLGYDVSHVANAVLAGRADEYSAVYYLLLRRRERAHLKLLKSLDGHDSAAGVSGPKLYDEATAMELAGRKNGSLHFKMALLMEGEENDGEATARSDGGPGEAAPTARPADQCAPVPAGRSAGPGDQAVPPGEQARDDSAAATGESHRETRAPKPGDSRTEQLPNFRSELVALRAIRAEDPDKAQGGHDLKEAQPEPIPKAALMPPGIGAIMACAAAYKPSPAHRVNLTFRQSDAPAGNFADHFRYRRGESGRRAGLVLAPTTPRGHQTTTTTPRSRPAADWKRGAGAAAPAPTWRPAASVDPLNLRNRLNHLRISPPAGTADSKEARRGESGDGGQAAVRTDSLGAPRHHGDISDQPRRRRPPQPPQSPPPPHPPQTSTADRRRQLRVSKRKSLDSIVLLRRSTRTNGRRPTARPSAAGPRRPSPGSADPPPGGRTVRGTSDQRRGRNASRMSQRGGRKRGAPDDDGDEGAAATKPGQPVVDNPSAARSVDIPQKTAPSSNKDRPERTPHASKPSTTNHKLAFKAVSAETVV